MKTYKHRNKEQVVSVVGSFGPREINAEPLFDDCAICRELKAQIERGEVEEVEIDLDLNMDFGKPN